MQKLSHAYFASLLILLALSAFIVYDIQLMSMYSQVHLAYHIIINIGGKIFGELLFVAP